VSFDSVKKSSQNTTENPDPVEESFQADVQYAAGDNQYAAEDKQYAAEDNQYGAEDNQYAAEDNQYAAEDNQYAPENTEYSEENQFTWGVAGRDGRGFGPDLEWHKTTSPL